MAELGDSSDVLGEQVELEIYFRAGLDGFQAGDFVSVGDDPEGEAAILQFRDGEADSVHADGAFVYHEVGELRR